MNYKFFYNLFWEFVDVFYKGLYGNYGGFVGYNVFDVIVEFCFVVESSRGEYVNEW